VLTTNVERLEGSSYKLTVTVSADEVDAAIRKAYDRLGSKVRIPGFRKGKAPRPVVDNYLGRKQVLVEATEDLVQETYEKAIDTEGLRTIDSPEIGEIEPVVEGEEFTYEAQVEVRPELTLTHIDGIAVTVPPKEPTEAMIDEQVELARDRFASLEPVEDRGIEPNDFAIISFVGDVNGEPFDGNQVEAYLYELGKGSMPEEFDNGLLGAKAGEERRVEFTIPGTSSRPEFVGGTAGFNVTIHEVKAKALPEVDDEFAVSVGGFDTVEQMREDLRSRLAVSQMMQHQTALQGALREELASRLEGDAPEPLIRQRAAQMMRDFKNMLDQREMTIPQYLNSTGMSVEEMEADIDKQAAESVKEELALEALFRSEGMEITDEDVDSAINSMVPDDEDAEETRKRWLGAGMMPLIHEQIMHDHAMKWLLDHADITVSDTTEPAADKAAPETTEE
jgi:trigger factor